MAEHDPIEIDFPSLAPRSDPEPAVDDVMEIPDDAEDDLSWLALAFADDDADDEPDTEPEGAASDTLLDDEAVPSLEDIEAVASIVAPAIDDTEPHQQAPGANAVTDPADTQSLEESADLPETSDLPPVPDLDDVLRELDVAVPQVDAASHDDDVAVPAADSEMATELPTSTALDAEEPAEELLDVVIDEPVGVDTKRPMDDSSTSRTSQAAIPDPVEPATLEPLNPELERAEMELLESEVPEPNEPERSPEVEDPEPPDSQKAPASRPRRSGLREELMGTFSQLYGK